MAQNDSAQAPINVVEASVVGEAIARGIAEGLKAVAPPRKVEFGEFDGKSPFDVTKDGSPKTKLTRDCFQNGAKMRPEMLFDEEIKLLNRIVRSGRYINRMVEVIVRDEGSDSVVELRYKNKTADQRSELKTEVKDLRTMLRRIVDEQDVEIENETPAKRR